MAHQTLKLITHALFAGVFIMMSLHGDTAFAGTVRNAAVAGKFYPSDVSSLRKELSSYLSVNVSLPEPPRLLICPHAGYVFSGPVAGMGYAAISENISRVIIIGPSHYEYIHGFTVTDAEYYETPLGKVKIDESIVARMMSSPLAHISQDAEEPEHCLEVQLPFLQMKLKDFTFVPVLTGKIEYEKLAELIYPMIDKNTLVIASSDLSHYHPQEEARDRDNRSVETILAGKMNGFIEACGETPIRVIMSLAKKMNCTPVKLDARTSWETAPEYGEKTRVVGYASIAYVSRQEKKETVDKNQSVEKKEGESFTHEEKKFLLKIARGSLDASVRKKHYEEPSKIPPLLREKRGCFVTLTVNEALRGCIGYIEPVMPLYKAVIENAQNAALNDPRFNPVIVDELVDINIEISVLTVPQPLEYADPDDLLDKLRPEIDGVILLKGGYQATFLPQVWEKLPDKIQFLQNLSIKAGLPNDGWKTASYKIYQALHFEEGEK